MKLAETIERAIRQQGLLRPGEAVAVACSGGADSVALLLLLDELKDSLGLRLRVAHLNHQLRGEESEADEAFVRGLAARLGLEGEVRREDVAARAKKKGANLEEAGREARLEFFGALLAAGRADGVALAHTMDDQVETVLARLVRGAGTRGLAGIYPVVELERGRLVRPLLTLRRAELRAYLSEREQSWREDASNLDRGRLRSRIRLDLLPQLNPAAVKHVARLAGHAREEESFWSALVEERFRELAVREQDGWALEVAALLAPSPELTRLPERAAGEAQRALARRLMRRALRTVRGDLRRITQTHVESVLRLAESGRSGQRVELPGVVVERVFERLVFRGPGMEKGEANDYQVEVEGPGTVELPTGRVLSVKLVAVSDLQSGYNDVKGAADAARARFPLRVRAWRPGDRFRPQGALRGKKLKTLFRQQRVPREERRRTPVVLGGGEILWVPRLGVAAGYELTAESQTALLITERGRE